MQGCADATSSGLNLVFDCSRLFLVRRNMLHKSHVSPIRVGPHFHLHLYPDAGATAGGIESTVKSRAAPSAYQAPNGERWAYCCNPVRVRVRRWKLGTWRRRLRACPGKALAETRFKCLKRRSKVPADRNKRVDYGVINEDVPRRTLNHREIKCCGT